MAARIAMTTDDPAMRSRKSWHSSSQSSQSLRLATRTRSSPIRRAVMAARVVSGSASGLRNGSGAAPSGALAMSSAERVYSV
ncbi:hypothetical protein D3867_27465 (plasmid) [Azospirillum argentinense]|uniref:Uncharacterized protein n=1 Tax=Azospirillum brasilense TaxID=192 RepID=A0A4D8Q8S3_AZOBR|nr:hypothetical protein D3867_27465 [Azospirillum argentinense]